MNLLSVLLLFFDNHNGYQKGIEGQTIDSQYNGYQKRIEGQTIDS
jgi:ribosome modulation factor